MFSSSFPFAERLSSSRKGGPAFTLVELMISVALLTLLLLMLVSVINSTASTARYTTGKIEQFRGAGNAFEAITRRVSQATLNTYWDYDNPAAPTKYLRQSDLRFASGATETLVGNAVRRPTHGIFFQAPLGFVDDPSNFGGLDNLVNTWGYYVEFNKDVRPPFFDSLTKAPPLRYRYRLMELMQPSNELNIYSYTSGTDSSGVANSSSYTGKDWFTEPLNSIPPPVHVLAENVIALVLLPKLAPKDENALSSPPSVPGTALTPFYSYDSTATYNSGVAAPGSAADAATLSPKNQLPPIVQVTLVAIDEVSANRIAKGSKPPAFDAVLDTLFQDATKFDADLSTLQTALRKDHINFRVFTSNVSLRGAKWSRN